MQAFAKRTIALSFCLASTMMTSLPAFGWGQTGHRVTGAIAEKHLTPAAKAAIVKLLPNESLAEASTYPDEMRSDPSEFWRKTSPPWHYVTVPEGHEYHEVGAPEQGDAYTALQHFTTVLKDTKASREDRQVALRFIVHIIGDLHQPLHAGNGTDRGGNSVKVRFFWQDSNLHTVWDSKMLDSKQLSYTEWTDWLDKKITTKTLKDWQALDANVWIKESTEIRDTIYPEDANDMSYDYVYDFLPVAKTRLQQAGVRIAAYLNNVFANTK